MGDGEEVKKDGEVARGFWSCSGKNSFLEKAPGTVGGEEASGVEKEKHFCGGAFDSKAHVDHAMHVFGAEVAGEKRPAAHDYGDGSGDEGKRTGRLVAPGSRFLRKLKFVRERWVMAKK